MILACTQTFVDYTRVITRSMQWQRDEQKWQELDHNHDKNSEVADLYMASMRHKHNINNNSNNNNINVYVFKLSQWKKGNSIFFVEHHNILYSTTYFNSYLHKYVHRVLFLYIFTT